MMSSIAAMRGTLRVRAGEWVHGLFPTRSRHLDRRDGAGGHDARIR